jgi:hypothetical protein
MPPDAADGSDARLSDGADDDGSTADLCRANPDLANTACPEICPEICNGRDDDCDGTTDEAASAACDAAHANGVCQSGSCYITKCLTNYRDCDQKASTGCEVSPTDPNNCGSCGRVCNIANAVSTCADGQCLVDHCQEGYSDCDSDRASCETRTNTLTDCGGCGIACTSVPHAVPSCATGACGPASCNAGYGDCDNLPENGCEQPLDSLAHCGGCNKACGKANCGGGICTAADCTATPGFADCDKDEASCEADLRSDIDNCAACGNKCKFTVGVTPHASLSCAANGCAAQCDAGYGNCDGNYANGCEQPLNTMMHCGGCGKACSIGNAAATCTSGSCTVQSCQTDYGDCDADQKSCEAQLNTPTRCGSCAGSCNLFHTNEACGGAPGTRVCTVGSCETDWADCDGVAANGCERDVRPVASGGLGPCLPDTGCTQASTGGHDYYFCPTARTWADARSHCQVQLRGDLAQLADAAEDTFVRSRTPAISWIGDTDSAIEGLWVWANNRVPFWKGTASGSAQNALYSNWASGEPNASGNCGVLYTSGQFDDANCNSTLSFVCEVSPDACPSDSGKIDPEQCGCGTPDVDSDNDGFANCKDACPNDPAKLTAGVCGCGVSDADSDGDGVVNCQDGCPNDPAKIAAGTCGCGVSEADTDSDGALDCVESCDTDPAKQTPGICGCGQADTDSDGDGTANCLDGCAADPSTAAACFPFTQSNFNPATINFSTTPISALNCGTTTINTSTTPATFTNWCGTVPIPIVQTQSGGPDAVVIALKGLTVALGSTLRLVGSRPVIFAVRGNVTVDGTIDANASGTTPGAGGEWSCGSSGGGTGTGNASFGKGAGGGGGGAFGTNGGRGGQGDNSNNYGAGGSARGNANMIPLYGGCGGGGGGGCNAAGGAAGGAVQITASGTIDINGTIRANGTAGATGCGTEGGGGGGGSGGAILLEAATRDTVGATITANGANGGDGNGLSNGNGGGGSSSSGSGGGNGQDANGAGGGGGGGYGRIKK